LKFYISVLRNKSTKPPVKLQCLATGTELLYYGIGYHLEIRAWVVT